MTDLVRINGDYGIGVPVTLADGSRFIAPAFVAINASGAPLNLQGGTDLDTDGNVVPTYKAHSYTYDPSGNLQTDSVTDGAATWVRTYGYTMGAQSSDSGWVKQ